MANVSVGSRKRSKRPPFDDLRTQIRDKFWKKGIPLYVASKAIGKNATYLQFYIYQGTPIDPAPEIKEEIAKILEESVDEVFTLQKKSKKKPTTGSTNAQTSAPTTPKTGSIEADEPKKETLQTKPKTKATQSRNEKQDPERGFWAEEIIILPSVDFARLTKKNAKEHLPKTLIGAARSGNEHQLMFDIDDYAFKAGTTVKTGGAPSDGDIAVLVCRTSNKDAAIATMVTAGNGQGITSFSATLIGDKKPLEFSRDDFEIIKVQQVIF